MMRGVLLTIGAAWLILAAVVLWFGFVGLFERMLRVWTPLRSLAEWRLFVRLFVRGDRDGA